MALKCRFSNRYLLYSRKIDISLRARLELPCGMIYWHPVSENDIVVYGVASIRHGSVYSHSQMTHIHSFGLFLLLLLPVLQAHG